jgi:hypothetical protein
VQFVGRIPNQSQALSSNSRLKMHLRVLTIGGTTYRVVTPRPGTTAFSTNFFHQTWHIVTSQPGARLLSRLLWGLSYERHPNTFLLVHGDHLLPTPFEAERSDPFVLTSAGLTRLDPSHLRVLKSRLQRLGPPTQTIRWHTFGLDAVLQGRLEGRESLGHIEEESDRLWRKGGKPLWHQERMERLGGIICYSAPPAVLRRQALAVHGLRVRPGDYLSEMAYHFLAERSSTASWCGDGEVQIFVDYVDRVAAAVQARREILPNPKRAVISETMQELISRRRNHIVGRRKAGRRRAPAKRP